jgi:hypothetical protein
MNRNRLIPLNVCIYLLFLLICTPSYGQKSLSHLNTWANEYPIDQTVRPKRNIFLLPEVRQPLLRLLGTQNFRRLLNTFDLENPIDLIDGNLVIDGFKRLSEHNEKARVVININTGIIHVRFEFDDKKETFSSKGNFSDLPTCIQGETLAIAHPKRTQGQTRQF